MLHGRGSVVWGMESSRCHCAVIARRLFLAAIRVHEVCTLPVEAALLIRDFLGFPLGIRDDRRHNNQTILHAKTSSHRTSARGLHKLARFGTFQEVLHEFRPLSRGTVGSEATRGGVNDDI